MLVQNLVLQLSFLTVRNVAHIIPLCALSQLASPLPPELAVSVHCAPTLPRYPKPEAFLHSLLPHEELAGRMARAPDLSSESNAARRFEMASRFFPRLLIVHSQRQRRQLHYG